MADIVLATLNAKYIHASFGLRCLLANLDELRPLAQLEEFVVDQRPLEIAERILAHQPRIVGLGVYIWNATPSCELVVLLKRIRPDLIVVLGGPEVSHETEAQEITRVADYTIAGEGDVAFADLCREILADRPPPRGVIAPPKPDLARLALPYDEYTADDIAHRLIYVEASRGCPFRCEFCLSSLEESVRAVPLDPFLAALQRLLDRGVQHFKFVDRTFNLNPTTSRRIVGFFLERLRPGLFLHFEVVPDRLPPELGELLGRFPAGHVQLEVGVQTFNPEAATLISRRQDYPRLEQNLRFLRTHTSVHVHADLIVGLPGETLESFAAGFDRLVALGPQEIQVGILKRLRGAPIARHDRDWAMVYSPLPPYEILHNRLIDFPALQRLRRFARYWDLIGNSGNFVETTPLVWADGASPFRGFLRLSDWLHATDPRSHAIALTTLMERVFRYLTQELGHPAMPAAEALWRDFQRGYRGDMPVFLRTHLPSLPVRAHLPRPAQSPTALRQSRHQAIPAAESGGPAAAAGSPD